MFSIVIANWNGSKLIDKCLSSLTKQRFKEFNVCIVDNGSVDDSIDVIKEYENQLSLNIIKLEKNEGFAKANNIGINKAMEDQNEYVLTLNNDIEVEENCLFNLNKFITDNKYKYDIFQILMINYYDRDIIDSTGLYFKKNHIGNTSGYKKPLSSLNTFNKDIQGACAGAAVYSKKALNMIKDKNGDYFDASFFAYYEDVDIAMRFMNGGFKTALVKYAKVYHMHSATTKKNSELKEYYITRNLLLYLYKNLSPEVFNKNKISYYKVLIVRATRLALGGDFKCIKALIKGWRDYYKLRGNYRV
jgi:GT2 family glycosyltransferase